MSRPGPGVPGDAPTSGVSSSAIACVTATTALPSRYRVALPQERPGRISPPIRVPLLRGDQPKLLGTPPAGGLPPALRLRGSRMSTYPAARRGSNGMHGGGEPLSRSCQGRPQPHVVPVKGRWKLPLRVSQGCRNRLPSGVNPRGLTHSGFSSVLRLRVQKKPPGGGSLMGVGIWALVTQAFPLVRPGEAFSAIGQMPPS